MYALKKEFLKVKQVLKGLLSLSLLVSAASMRADRDDCNTSCNTSCENSCDNACDFSNCCEDFNKCCEDDTYYGRSHFSYRPQGLNAARFLMGTGTRTHIFGREEFYGVASLALEFQQTFESEDNCKTGFGTWFSPRCSNCFTFGPDQNAATAAQNPNVPGATGITSDLKQGVDIRSLDFGMSSSHKSTLCIKPKIKNIIADLDFWFGLDEFMCGLWARLDIPLTWTKWEMCVKEKELNAGGTNYGPGSLTTCPVANPVPAVVYTKQKDAWCGDKAFGQVPALKYGKLCCGKNDDFSVSGIRFDLGYDFWREECGHLGAALTFIAGIGTKPCAERVFQPIVGAQHSWQFGGNLTGSYEFWNGEENNSMSVLADATFVHVFKHKQKRVFGLKERGAWSQYLLLKKFKKDTNNNLVLDGYEHAANILAADVKISNNIMVDAALALAYQNCNFTAMLGADVWYRSYDKINDSCGFAIADNTYGINGYTGCDLTTASLSTINTSAGLGTNNTYGLTGDGRSQIPTGVPLTVNDGYVANPQPTPGNAYIPNTVFLKSSDVDACTGLHPDALSGKIFGSLEYGWDECDWNPYVLVGGEVEFGRGNTAADQWGVIFKGGVSF
jgi:hypothetical protein